MSFLEDMVLQEDLHGLDVPVRPPMASSARPPSPRTFSTHRTHDDDVADVAMRQRRPKLKCRRNSELSKSKRHTPK